MFIRKKKNTLKEEGLGKYIQFKNNTLVSETEGHSEHILTVCHNPMKLQ